MPLSAFSDPEEALRLKLTNPDKAISSPNERVWSPDILKRIIEGHETTEIFEECLEAHDYDEKADLLVHELTKYLHSSQLETSQVELDALRSNVSKLDADNSKLIREGEEQLRANENKHEQTVKLQAHSFAQKMSQKEQELFKEHDFVIQNHQHEKGLLEEKFEQMKSDDLKTKETLKNATVEILRLEENLKDTICELNLERKKHTRVERELENTKSLKEKVGNLQTQLTSLTDVREKQKKRIRELELINKELRDQNDEFYDQLQSDKEGRSSRKNSDVKFGDGVSRNGSYLSDYMKPDIVKRNMLGESHDEDRMPDMGELKSKISEQEMIITSLRRDLETVNRLLNENTSNINERHMREINRLTDKYAAEISDLQNLMSIERDELIQYYSKDKDDLIVKYEKKLEGIQKQFASEKQTLMQDYENERDRWELSSNADRSEKEFSFKRERRRIENSFREEKEELEMDYRSQLTKLEEKVVILETEKAEMELTFLNEKAELEQKFRIERAELQQNATSTSREYDKSQQYIDFLKDDLNKKHAQAIVEIERKHKNEKQDMVENTENVIESLKKSHQKDMNELKKGMNQQVSDLEQCFVKERASIKESFLRDKSEMEQKFLREKTEQRDTLKQEYEHELALKLADLRKASVEERALIEENLRHEKYELSKNWQHEKASAERNLKQMKTELELSFAEEKSRLQEQFDFEKTVLENKYKREIAELQQAFSGGEAGLKGKMKEDFSNVINRYKIEWESSFEKEKSELLQSFAREKAALELSWQVEKTSMEENFDSEKSEMEASFSGEKQELFNKFQNQKQKLENEYQKEARKLRENRDAEFYATVNRETELLQNTIEHLEKELISLKEQKKELETRNQILELKSISQKHEAAEINEFQKERKQINQKLSSMLDEITSLKTNREELQKELANLTQEKTTILDNSVHEITEQQEVIARLQGEKEVMQDKVQQLLLVEKEAEDLKRDNLRMMRECAEKERHISSLTEVEKDNKVLSENVRMRELREHDIEAALQEKILKITRLEHETTHYQNKIENMEGVHRKEMDVQKEMFHMHSTAATTEKSRLLQELQELKDHLYRANASSDRDNALKEKVFNDAKAEVMSLNKKLEEKSRKIRSLNESLKLMEGKLYEASQLRDDNENQVTHLKTLLNENETKARDEKKNITTKSVRSDTLVTDLYLENAELMKQVANAESNQAKTEKQVRQLTEQKRALQRVISKLCHANGITNLTT